MPQYDDLLEDAPDSQAFDADLEPVGYDPDELGEHESGVVIEEPKMINIGRKLKKDDLRKLSQPDQPA